VLTNSAEVLTLACGMLSGLFDKISAIIYIPGLNNRSHLALIDTPESGALMRSRSRRPGLAFLYAVPIGLLGGLIGLGGAEFRLPVLAGPLRYSARQAVPLNLAISFVTLAVALAIRGRTLSVASLMPFLPAVCALIAGAVVTAFIGPALASGLSEERLERVILVLLVCIGLALITEGLLPQ
jgi:uncharacterized protein